MGIILSKFRKKKTSEEVLESIEETICSIEESQKESQQQQRKIRQCSFISVTLLVFALFFYMYFFSISIRRHQAFLFVIPILIIGEIMRRIISWYYKRKIVKTQKKLIDLRAQKKKILDEVMNSETFNKAKEILEKYAPDQLPKGVVPVFRGSLTPLTSNLAKTPANLQQNSKKVLFTPNKSVVPSPAPAGNNMQALVKSMPTHNLPRPILSADKTVLEKLVEIIVGDGPSQRYALICSACSSHNGMSLKEEFEYLAYRCAYCNHFNPARKQRLVAPKLPDYPYSALLEEMSHNSSLHSLKSSPSKQSNTSVESISGKELNQSHIDEKADVGTHGKVDSEIGGVVEGESKEKIKDAADGEKTGKQNTSAKDEVDGEISVRKDDNKTVDDILEEKDLGEYVSDEDSLSESETPLRKRETTAVH